MEVNDLRRPFLKIDPRCRHTHTDMSMLCQLRKVSLFRISLAGSQVETKRPRRRGIEMHARERERAGSQNEKYER